MQPCIAGLALLLFGTYAGAQPRFAVAQVKPSKRTPGRAWERITTDPGRLTGAGVTLKQLIFEAYDMPYYRIFGGPSWLESEYYDLEAKADGPAGRDQLRLMLRDLLANRFQLKLHRETKELKAYVLTVVKSGARLSRVKEGDDAPDRDPPGYAQHFRCDLTEFANVVSLRLNMPAMEDPTVPVRSTGVPVPVINKTGIEGVFDIRVEVKVDPGEDTFVAWQRALQDQLGLKLESQKGPVEVLLIDHAERVAAEN